MPICDGAWSTKLLSSGCVDAASTAVCMVIAVMQQSAPTAVYLAVERVFAATEKKSQLNARAEAALKMIGLTHAIHKHPKRNFRWHETARWYCAGAVD